MAAERFYVTRPRFRLSPGPVRAAAMRLIFCALLLVAVSSIALVAKADALSQAKPSVPGPRPPAKTPEGEAKEVSIRLLPNERSSFQVEVFPTKGVAVVDIYEGRGDAVSRSVAYAISIPPAPFDGSVDLNFPGLGRIIGSISVTNPLGPAAQAKLCEGDYPDESATFTGHLAFRGSGDHGRWRARKAEANITLTCGVRYRRENARAALLDHVGEFGPVLSGPVPIRLSADGEAHHRNLGFAAWASPPRGDVQFVVIDREWLRGEVATERWAKRETPSLKTLKIQGEAKTPRPPTSHRRPPSSVEGRTG